MLDGEGRLTFANREFATIVGESSRRILGRPLADWVHREDRAQLLGGLRSVQDGGKRLQTRLRLTCGDGGHRWMQCSAMLREDAAAAHVIIGSMVDIEEQVRAQDNLKEASRHKDEFLAMLGHELRNPLAPIRNAAEVLKVVAPGDERLVWVHDVVVRQVNHVTRLVDDLLDISLITRGTLKLRVEPVELGALLRRSIEDVRAHLERKHHRLDVDLPDETTWVEGDPIRLSQVFDNLLTNAAKYTDEGGALSISLEADPDTVRVRVSDNGLGLAPEMRLRVFDLFVQDARAIDRSQGGMGIGLALVKHLVVVHGGTIEAHSAGSGQGSTFEVQLPRLGVSQPRIDAGAMQNSSTGGRVLVVDDDRDAAESMGMLLQISGFETVCATDLETALHAARRLRPQVVLLDLGMPGADGYEVARRLKAVPGVGQELRLVALSGFGQAADFDRTAAAGFSGHLVKPVEPAELVRVLRELMPD